MAVKQAARDMKGSTTASYLGAGNTFDSHETAGYDGTVRKTSLSAR